MRLGRRSGDVYAVQDRRRWPRWAALLGVPAILGGWLATRCPAGADPDAAEQALAAEVTAVLGEVQSYWRAVTPRYRDARLVLYRGGTRTACGLGTAPMGPFYCPADEAVYLDLAFFTELPAGADFARAYVIAHEVGHHVQRLRGGADSGELEADCLAGAWAAAARRDGLLDPGDIEEALAAAAAVGDDALGVAPEQWTHGSARQRAEAFRRGLGGGDCAP